MVDKKAIQPVSCGNTFCSLLLGDLLKTVINWYCANPQSVFPATLTRSLCQFKVCTLDSALKRRSINAVFLFHWFCTVVPTYCTHVLCMLTLIILLKLSYEQSVLLSSIVRSIVTCSGLCICKEVMNCYTVLTLYIVEHCSELFRCHT